MSISKIKLPNNVTYDINSIYTKAIHQAKLSDLTSGSSYVIDSNDIDTNQSGSIFFCKNTTGLHSFTNMTISIDEGHSSYPVYRLSTDTPCEEGAWRNNEVALFIFVDRSVNPCWYKVDSVPSFDSLLQRNSANNAYMRNSMYRGAYIGSSVNSEQWAAIKAGTFDDLYLGDYWTINGTSYIIAHFDFFYGTGDTECTNHHVVLIPSTYMYKAKMHSTGDTTGGYLASDMHTTNLETARSTISTDFGSTHILSHREYLTSTVSSGTASACTWTTCTAEIPNELMMLGCMPRKNNAYEAGRTTLGRFAVFNYAPNLAFVRGTSTWLRTVASAANYASIASEGCYVQTGSAAGTYGVRPYFAIYDPTT